MKFVYYGKYAEYFEVARVETLRSLGVTYNDLEKKIGILMPVLNLNIQYLHPALYDENLYIETLISSKPTATIRFDYLITNDNKILIAKGFTTLAFLSSKNMKPVRPPKVLTGALDKYLK